MSRVLEDLRGNPMNWLLVFVPAVLVAEHLRPESHTALFLLSVAAIIPLAGLLSHATESVAAKTGDAIGGLLNATLGNLTELVIAITALRRRDARPREGLGDRGRRDQQPLHAGRRVPARRA